MAETITIPSSPSFFLNAADAVAVQPPPLPKAARRPPPSPKDGPKPSESSGITKRKQSKSRNGRPPSYRMRRRSEVGLTRARLGCITCKAKRLKCDETKPTCQQCARRSVPCGGYKKDFKWRPFEETNLGGKVPGKAKKGAWPVTDSGISDSSQAPVHRPLPPHLQTSAPWTTVRTRSSRTTTLSTMRTSIPRDRSRSCKDHLLRQCTLNHRILWATCTLCHSIRRTCSVHRPFPRSRASRLALRRAEAACLVRKAWIQDRQRRLRRPACLLGSLHD
jgi:hypothetical protein